MIVIDPALAKAYTRMSMARFLDTRHNAIAVYETAHGLIPADADWQDRERADCIACLDALPDPWDASTVAILYFCIRLAERVDAACAAYDVAAPRLLIEAFRSQVEM